MASIDGISLDCFAQGTANAAAAFILRDKASESLTLIVSDQWEVEIKSGSKFVVARTKSRFLEREIVDRSIAAVHEALDLAAVVNLDPLTPDKPMDQYLLLDRSSRSRLEIQQFISFPVIVGTPTLQTIRADGSIETHKTEYPKWTPAFRFYRLSQVSSDIFEAYRNLFLALEALLDLLCPKDGSERERQWLVRSVGQLVSRSQLEQVDPGENVKSPEELVNWLYDVRLNLFHAKHGRTYLSEFKIAYSTVANAYAPLMRLWRSIAERSLRARALGGALTYVAFRMGMEAGFANARMAVTADDTPVAGDQDDFSPRGEDVFKFPENLKIESGKSGRMNVSSAVDVVGAGLSVLGRIGLMSEDDQPMIVSDDCGRVDLSGIRTLEIRFVMRLLNKKQARTEFL